MGRRLYFAVNVLAVIAVLIQGGFTHGQAVSNTYLEGTFLTVWGDGAPDSGDTTIAYFLSTKSFGTIQLNLSEDTLASAGGPVGLNHKAVVAHGYWRPAGKSMLVQELTLLEGQQSGPDGVYGPQPWVSILCKFNDVEAEPDDLNFFKQMYSAQYPGLDHFWRQNSYELANLDGSDAFGWYVLPDDREAYLPGGHLDWGKAAHDCTAAAEQDVYFPQFVGINLMFNANLDDYAWGGSRYLCLDGVCQVWRMTWEPPWGYENIGVIAHETGHGFGLPHSEGMCHQTYDNRWDVMSDVWSNGADPYWGTMGQHTISYHKELDGWIQPGQFYVAHTGSMKSISLEKLALPQTGNYLGVQIPINGDPNHFYTLEVRQPSEDPIDYDKWLPGFAVIIHDVVPGRENPAVVMDQDGDCYNGDAGAMFTPGEVFSDEANGISVSIDTATGTGYIVTINNRFTVMTNVILAGAAQGNIGESIPFIATVSPAQATLPITYTWQATGYPPTQHSGSIVDTEYYLWDDAGTKAITVTASNAGGSVMDTHTVEIVDKALTVNLSGPDQASIGLTSLFTATVIPDDVQIPITYTWQASGQTPITRTNGLSDTIGYTWDNPGMQVITVTVTNVDGSATNHQFTTVLVPPASLVIGGADRGNVHDLYTFTAQVNPITTTVPITYVWTVDEQTTITHSAGISDQLSISWDQPGTHLISVKAGNAARSVEAYREIEIFIYTFLPMELRN
jgi:M6 family metalloprotease-like protein